jgi:hypothetical protein
MLSIRFAVIAAICGVALWGLFALLDNLREPKLLRSKQAVVVKGCEPMESAEAVRSCPPLFCQKFLLDQRALPRDARFEMTVDVPGGQRRLVGGRALAGQAEQRFACIVEGTKVVAGRIIDAAQLDALAGQTGDWAFEE